MKLRSLFRRKKRTGDKATAAKPAEASKEAEDAITIQDQNDSAAEEKAIEEPTKLEDATNVQGKEELLEEPDASAVVAAVDESLEVNHESGKADSVAVSESSIKNHIIDPTTSNGTTDNEIHLIDSMDKVTPIADPFLDHGDLSELIGMDLSSGFPNQDKLAESFGVDLSSAFLCLSWKMCGHDPEMVLETGASKTADLAEEETKDMESPIEEQWSEPGMRPIKEQVPGDVAYSSRNTETGIEMSHGSLSPENNMNDDSSSFSLPDEAMSDDKMLPRAMDMLAKQELDSMALQSSIMVA